MENNQISVTALVTAFSRAYHSLNVKPPVFDDFLARQMFTDEQWSYFSYNIAESLKFLAPQLAVSAPDQTEALNRVMKIQNAPLTLSRSQYTEECLEEDIVKGIGQYVILGAGLDTFAFRKPDVLKKLEVFELDHPATQAYKLNRIAESGWQISEQLHFIPLDFTKESLEAALGKSSYDPNIPSLFSWLGVTFYLEKEIVFDMLRTFARIASRGSRIIFDYFDNDAFIPEKASKRVQLMQEIVRRAGEPMKSGFDPEALAQELKDFGLEIVEDLSLSDIQERYFKGRTDGYEAYDYAHFARVAVV